MTAITTGITNAQMNAEAHTLHNLRRFIVRRVPDEAIADDLIQDVLLRLTQASAKKPVDNISAWLYRSARNALTDYYRTRRVGLSLDAVLNVPSSEYAFHEDGVAASRELAGCLAPMVSALALPYQQAITLVEMNGMTQTAAAAMVGISVSGMKSRVQRGRAMLRASILRCCDVSLNNRHAVTNYTCRNECD